VLRRLAPIRQVNDRQQELEARGDNDMSVMMVRAKIHQDKVGEVEEAARRVFAAVEAERPGGVRYASSRLPDGVTFVVLLELEGDGANPLEGIQAFTEFQSNLRNWVAEPPTVEPLQVVGSYRLFGSHPD
jgi:quinol monooxygenase YgiN